MGGDDLDAQRQIAGLSAALMQSRAETAAARLQARASDEAAQTFELRVREVDHRAKNALQLAAAMLLMQAQASDDGRVQHQLRSAVARLNTLAEVHAALYRVEDHENLLMRPWLERVCDGFQWNPKIQMSIQTPDLSWPVRLATPVGLFVGEAVANAVKHAFAARETGRIEIRLAPLQGDSWRLSVADDGVGVIGAVSGGLGMKLLQVFSRQLGGDLAVVPTASASGVCVGVEFQGPDAGEARLL